MGYRACIITLFMITKRWGRAEISYTHCWNYVLDDNTHLIGDSMDSTIDTKAA